MLENYNKILNYKESDNILEDAKNIIDSSLKCAYQAANIFLVYRNWYLGKRIATEELKKSRKENYGKEIIDNLSQKLTEEYGKGFNKTNLYNCYKFYKFFPNIFQTLSGKSSRLLSWSHYTLLLNIDDEEARTWYENEARNANWNFRELRRNITTDYYHRNLLVQSKKVNKNQNIVQDNVLDYIKNPYIAEFLGFNHNEDLSESDIESAIINHLEEFMMEMGKGFAFVGRQFRIETEYDNYYIDLVFYNYILKCFVIIDIKTGEINHQDLGQMDMYIRMFDELKKEDDDNPTIGILLGTETKKSVVKYSILKDNKGLFMSKYKLYLPNKKVLEEEINNAIDNLKINEDNEKYGEENIFITIVKALNEIVDIKLKNKNLNLVVVELGDNWYK